MEQEQHNIVRFWQEQVRTYGERPAYRFKRDGEWISRSWREYGDMVNRFAMGLLALGMNPGEAVAVLGSTREEWDLADRAALAIGCIGVGVYHSSTPEQIRYILDHSEARILVVENEELWKKIKEIRSQLPNIRRFVLMDPLPGGSDEDVMDFAEVLELGRRREEQGGDKAYRQRGDNIRASDAAIYVYTSGTTGPPKGAILTHGNIMAILDSFRRMKIFVPEEDRTVAWLPLPHVFGRFVILSAIHNTHIWSYAGTVETLLEDLADIRPTFFHSVPRIYEKIYQKMLAAVEQASPVRRRIFDFCLRTGRRYSSLMQQGHPIPVGLRLRYALADRLLFRKLRAIFGGRMRTAVTGGAPLSREILEFFHAAGMLILEGYGLTESPVATFNRPDRYKFGTVGPAVPSTEIRLADDGEILIRSPINFAGYLKAPEKTAEAFTDNDWYCTGDVGVISPDGFVTITDRKKDIIITAGGKNVAPQNIENLLKTSPFISQAMVYGDRKPYLTALITLDPDAFDEWTETRGCKGASLAELCEDPLLRNRVEEIIREKNRHLASYETIKKFIILPRDFSEEAGEITPTMKVKRRVVSEKYRDRLEKLYA